MTDDFGHFYIVVFGGDGICHLEGEGQTNEGAGEVGEQSVIEPLPSAESVTLLGEGHAWDDSQVYLGIVSEDRSCGFLDAKGW